MEYSLVKLSQLSGDKATLYTIYSKDTNETLFDRFLKENKNSFKSEIIDITERLKVIGAYTGCRVQYFRINEGELGDGICALYDNPEKNLRLYCIRFGGALLIIGGGGYKPEDIKAFQYNEKLKQENYLLRQIVKIISRKLKDKELKISTNLDLDLDYFEGDFDFSIDTD